MLLPAISRSCPFFPVPVKNLAVVRDIQIHAVGQQKLKRYDPAAYTDDLDKALPRSSIEATTASQNCTAVMRLFGLVLRIQCRSLSPATSRPPSGMRRYRPSGSVAIVSEMRRTQDQQAAKRMALLIVTVLPLADVLPTVCAQIPEALPERDLPTQSIIDDRGALIAPLKTDLKDLATGQPLRMNAAETKHDEAAARSAQPTPSST